MRYIFLVFILIVNLYIGSAFACVGDDKAVTDVLCKDVKSIDKILDEKFAPISQKIQEIVFYSFKIFSGTEHEQSIPLILIWLVVAAIFLTFYFGFVNIRYFAHAIGLLCGKFDKEKDGEGQINRFQALMTSLSGTVGLGNIAGVAVAISVGGPGAMLWMIIMGFFGMSAKFTECALGVKYRHKTSEGIFSGGPMYYLRDGFAEKGKKWGIFGKWTGVFFAICCIGGAIGGGNMFQANQAYQQLVTITGGSDVSFWADKGWLFGIILALAVGAVIIGGIKSIAKVTSKLVPFMAGLYLLAGIVILAMNVSNIPLAFVTIFKDAFGLDAAAGGFVGALLVSLLQGVKRAAFSNEAGIGSAAIAHASAQTNSPISQGIVAMLGPFIDTIIICTMTALVIVVTGAYQTSDGMEGVELTSRAFASGISWFPYILGVAVILFAFSTMISWSYYGLKSFTYLFGEGKKKELIYKSFFCILIILGSAANLKNVIDFTDAMIFAMSIPNIIALYILAPSLKKDLQEYRKKFIK